MRKKYLGKVKVKYLELRRGNLTYFGDNDGEGRRTVHLRAATASCNAIDDSSTDSDKDANGATTTSQSANKANSSSVSSSHAAASLSAGLTSAVNATTSAASTIAGGTSITAGFEFHLWVEGKRYAWLANSKNERQSWVRAIRQAMIGDDDDWGMTLNANNATNPEDVRAAHEEAMEKYQKLQQSLSDAASMEEYLESLLTLVPRPIHPAAAPALQIPLKCVLDQMPKEKNEAKKDGTSQRRRVKSSIAEFWNNLQSFDFSINGCAIDKESPFAAERIVGSLVRCILDFDRCFVDGLSSDQPHLPSLTEGPGAGTNDRPQQKRSDATRISELNAVSYARSILSLIIKSKTSGDVEFAVENLLKNEKLVKVDHINPSSALSTSSETLHIDVSFAGDDVVDHDDDSPFSNEVSGWVMVRRSKYNTWKTRFCVFSEGVFSYYENAKPRPHGLRGQLLLSGGSITKLDEKDRAREDSGLYILRLATKGQERERQFGFKSKDEMLEWKAVIQHELDACGTTRLPSSGSENTTREDGLRESSTGKKAMSIIEGGSKLISYATDESLKAIKGATGSSIKVVKGGTKVIKDATGAFTKGATNLMFRSIRSSRSRSKRGEAGRSMIRTPSLQFLMESTRTAKTGKREPTVQCIIQTTTDFRVQSAANSQNEAEENTLV
jgi:PH domain